MNYEKMAKKFLDPKQQNKSIMEILHELSAQPGFSHLDLAKAISSMVEKSMNTLDKEIRELGSLVTGRSIVPVEVETHTLERR